MPPLPRPGFLQAQGMEGLGLALGLTYVCQCFSLMCSAGFLQAHGIEGLGPALSLSLSLSRSLSLSLSLSLDLSFSLPRSPERRKDKGPAGPNPLYFCRFYNF